MQDYTGWTLGASWEDLKFDIKHFVDFSRIAIVGYRAWEHAMAVMVKPFTMAKVRYFDRSDIAQARAWLTRNE
jgi:SpoIIAA-like